MEAAPYTFNVELFGETGKIAFNIEIEKVEIDSVRPSIFQPSLSQDNNTRQLSAATGQLECYRVSVVAISSYSALAAAKQKPFNIPNPADCQDMLNKICAEPQD